MVRVRVRVMFIVRPMTYYSKLCLFDPLCPFHIHKERQTGRKKRCLVIFMIFVDFDID